MVSDLLMPSKVTGFLTCLLRHKNQSRKEMRVAVVSALPHTLWAEFPEALCDFWEFWKASLRGSAGSVPEKWGGVEEVPQFVVTARLRTAPSLLISLKGSHTHLASHFRLY